MAYQYNNRVKVKKILELLSVLILLGGRNVSVEQIEEYLWPDKDGDLSRQSFEVSLYRLRKLIGKDNIVTNSGLISLNDKNCWLDLWAFEETIVELEKALKDETQHSNKICILTDRILSLSHDTFMKNFNHAQVIIKREMLLTKLCHLLDLAASFCEKKDENDRACSLLKRNLELSPLNEAYYLHLISFYLKLGEINQALLTYRYCKQIFNESKLPISNQMQYQMEQLLDINDCGG